MAVRVRTKKLQMVFSGETQHTTTHPRQAPSLSTFTFLSFHFVCVLQFTKCGMIYSQLRAKFSSIIANESNTLRVLDTAKTFKATKVKNFVVSGHKLCFQYVWTNCSQEFSIVHLCSYFFFFLLTHNPDN